MVLQAVVGLIQFVIALAMLAGYRKTGVWGALDCGRLPDRPDPITRRWNPPSQEVPTGG